MLLVGALVDGPKTFGQLTTALDGLASPTLARLLNALLRAELIGKDQRTYHMGPRIHQLVRQVSGTLGPEALLAPIVTALAWSTRASAAFYAWQGEGVVLRAKHEIPESFHYVDIGGPVSELTRHGFAQVMVACMAKPQQRACYRRCPLRERRPLADFLVRCAKIRRDGYVIERGEHRSGVTRIAVALSGKDQGSLIGSLGISTLVSDAPEVQRQLELVLRAGATANSLLTSFMESA
jgi:DNA-binding IclR family transcriptional regulator